MNKEENKQEILSYFAELAEVSKKYHTKGLDSMTLLSAGLTFFLSVMRDHTSQPDVLRKSILDLVKREFDRK